MKELQAGKELRLEDGSILKIQLVQKFINAELQVLLNGQPLPGSASDPSEQLRNTYLLIFFIGGANIVAGLATELLQIESLRQISVGFVSVIGGGLYLLLGFFVKRGSMIALTTTVTLFILDGISIFILGAQQGINLTFGIVVRMFFLIYMIQGFSAIRALKQ